MRHPEASFAWAGSFMSIIFFVIVNFLTSPSHIWFIYPAFFLLLWPVSLHLITKAAYKIHSVFCSFLLIILLATINFLYSPEHPWFLYACYPVLWWPIFMYLGKYSASVSVAVAGSFVTIAYYTFLNAVISPVYPWAVFPAFAVLWWPLATFFARRKRFFQLSVWGSALTIGFFIFVNQVSTPDNIWAVYPIFTILWWPLTMYFFSFKRKNPAC
ncbi:hypothetical protein SAMN05421736_108127 [Evansella caseinilytica]|uniref:Uncharacterized protein n=1 Tax=Evansella caseinilytica TaxID=1503961 RepID=A0A1H3RJX7_9BACI|nr:hypothetical protein [Evansella caseinilytica]SDZ25665.1 hypothetical protein SAMN05421736_108127 [Evansella caseinilytica]